MPTPPMATAKAITWVTSSTPRGSGRPRVRAISASMRRSTRWLMAAAAPATNAMPSVPKTSTRHGIAAGLASSMPTTTVKTISATTRGLVSST